MKKFTLIIIIMTISVFSIQYLNAQDFIGSYEPCNKPINVSDSLEIIEMLGFPHRVILFMTYDLLIH